MAEVRTAEEYAQDMQLLIRSYDQARPRSIQSREHLLGVSDVGGCPEYARRMITQTPFTDSPDPWAAIMGTAIHSITKDARDLFDPDVHTDLELKLTMPNGVELTGHPDAVDPLENSVTDDKSKEGLGVVRNHGPEDKEWWQVAMYAKAAVDAGILEPDPIIRLVYFDRRGKDSQPVAFQQQGYDLEIAAANQWLDDVIYHVQHGEEADKTPAIEWCAAACPFYTGCRLTSDLPDADTELKEQRLINAVDTYIKGRELTKEAKEMMDSAKAELDGAVGVAPVDGVPYRVRWNSVNTTYVEGYHRAGYRKLDVRKVPKKKGTP